MPSKVPTPWTIKIVTYQPAVSANVSSDDQFAQLYKDVRCEIHETNIQRILSRPVGDEVNPIMNTFTLICMKKYHYK